LPKALHAESSLSRRERQIMDILYSLGKAAGPEAQERLPDQPSYSAVRMILWILERKGHIRHIL
jgi:predicted transcriptional regulator